MNRLHVIIVILMFLVFTSNGQSLDLWVIGSGGETTVSEKVNLQWTLGEIQVSSIRTSKGLYTEGFHQPYIQVINISNIAIPLPQQPDIKVFPNPASTELIIAFDQKLSGEYEYSLFNSGGKVADFGRLDFGLQTTLDVSRHIPGTYWLQLIHTDIITQVKQTTNFQIILQ